MKRKRFPADDPREWLNRAQSNLAHAKIAAAEVYLEDLCFDAQQAAEKAIKAVFISRREPFPFVHELKDLLRRLERTGLKVPQYVWAADKLSRFAVMMRYPGGVGPVNQRHYQRAVRLASAVLRWAERQVAMAQTKSRRKN